MENDANVTYIVARNDLRRLAYDIIVSPEDRCRLYFWLVYLMQCLKRVQTVSLVVLTNFNLST